jgi:hypothetical protein
MTTNSAVKKNVRKIFSMPLLYLDPVVAFNTNDVTLNSSIESHTVQWLIFAFAQIKLTVL